MKDKDKENKKVKAYFVTQAREGLLTAPEGWEIDGQPIVLPNGLILFPVESK